MVPVLLDTDTLSEIVKLRDVVVTVHAPERNLRKQPQINTDLRR